MFQLPFSLFLVLPILASTAQFQPHQTSAAIWRLFFRVSSVFRFCSHPCRQRWQVKADHTCTGGMTSAGSPCSCGGSAAEPPDAPGRPAGAEHDAETRYVSSFCLFASLPRTLTLWTPSSLTQTLLNSALKTLLRVKAKKRTVLSCRRWAISSKMAAASAWTSPGVTLVCLET